MRTSTSGAAGTPPGAEVGGADDAWAPGGTATTAESGAGDAEPPAVELDTTRLTRATADDVVVVGATTARGGVTGVTGVTAAATWGVVSSGDARPAELGPPRWPTHQPAPKAAITASAVPTRTTPISDRGAITSARRRARRARGPLASATISEPCAGR